MSELHVVLVHLMTQMMQCYIGFFIYSSERFRTIYKQQLYIVPNGSERFRTIYKNHLIYSSERFRAVPNYIYSPN